MGVERRDRQPMKHEIGNRTYLVADVEPLDVDGVRTVGVGTALFFLGFLALLPFYGRLREDGTTWWLWMCLTGAGLGLLGLEYCRRRRGYRAAEDDPHPASAAGPSGEEHREQPGARPVEHPDSPRP